VRDGSHVIVAEAWDSAGNVGSSPPIQVVVANNSSVVPEPTPSAPDDTTSPIVTLVQPSAATVLSGSATLGALVADDTGAVEVQYVVDGVVVAHGASASDWGALWQTTTVLDGPHTLLARARDAAGNVGESVAIWVTIANAGGVPDPPVGCRRPYTDASPWNKPLNAAPVVHPSSAFYVASMTPVLTSDPTQYTYPVYEVGSSTPQRTVKISGLFSHVASDTAMKLQTGGNVLVRIPDGARAAAGSDGQLILIDPVTGDEWGFWRLYRDVTGNWFATNGYHYNTNWSGVPPRGFASRGAGVPYLAGLVRPCEITRGHIDHALAFAYDYPTKQWVYPATKSDGKSTDSNDLPEGARLQLDPELTRDELVALGVTGPGLIVARALQEYGMYLIDGSGREKVMFEYEGTAHWNGLVQASTVSKIPLSRFRWVVGG
jgi:hypothetical protein